MKKNYKNRSILGESQFISFRRIADLFAHRYEDISASAGDYGLRKTKQEL